MLRFFIAGFALACAACASFPALAGGKADYKKCKISLNKTGIEISNCLFVEDRKTGESVICNSRRDISTHWCS
jgi:hypothetical protein